MDLKKEAARLAFRLVENNSSIGLGDGSAVLNLAAYLFRHRIRLQVTPGSGSTSTGR
jgi:DeoR/GlpR family transcriptional regulator of sugar metabolism